MIHLPFAVYFQLIMSYLLWPFAFIMGVATDDCRQVAELIGNNQTDVPSHDHIGNSGSLQKCDGGIRATMQWKAPDCRQLLHKYLQVTRRSRTNS